MSWLVLSHFKLLFRRLRDFSTEALGEDASLVRSGAQPQVLAALRTTPLTRLRAAGWRNIGAAIRHPTRCPRAAFRLLGVSRT